MTRARHIRVLVALLATLVVGQGLELPSTASRTAPNSRGQRARSMQNLRPRAGSVLKALQVQRDLAPPGDDSGDPSTGLGGRLLFHPSLVALGPVRPPALEHPSEFLPVIAAPRGPPSFACPLQPEV